MPKYFLFLLPAGGLLNVFGVFFWRDLSPEREEMVSRWIWGETGIRAVAADARRPTQKSGLSSGRYLSLSFCERNKFPYFLA